MKCGKNCKADPFYIVFGPLNKKDIVKPVHRREDIPETVEAGGKEIQPVQIPVTGHYLDLKTVVEKPDDNTGALVYLPFRINDPGKYIFGIGVDWWMTVYIDGIKIIETTFEGNIVVPTRFWNFTRELEMEAGEHLLAVRMTGGSNGAEISCAMIEAEDFQAVCDNFESDNSKSISLVVDFTENAAPFRRVHGMCNGPNPITTPTDVSDEFRRLNVPWCRLHDSCGIMSPVVDIPAIFPLFDADPDDPANYRFGPTDEYLENILAAGAQIIFRLGVSIENRGRHYYTRPPSDMKKWAKICVNIIRHINDGWGEDGRHFNIRMWEIWNEPAGPYMWFGGTQEDYNLLYKEAVTAIKSYDPTLLVGGPAAAFITKTIGLLEFCREEKLPMDFLSWHRYTLDPDKVIQDAFTAETLLEEYGFPNALNVCDEWSIGTRNQGWEQGVTRKVDALNFEEIHGEKAASFCAYVLCGWQDSPIDIATFYAGEPGGHFNSVFGSYGERLKPFYTFLAFNFLTSMPTRLKVSVPDLPGYKAIAGYDPAGGEAAILIARYGGEQYQHIPVTLANMPGDLNEAVIMAIDHDYDLEVMKVMDLPAGTGTIDVICRDNSVMLVRLRKKRSKWDKILWEGNN